MTYYVVLSDMDGNVDWLHPSEIEARDKQDAFNAIAESCDPQYIKKVFSKDEYINFVQNSKNRRNIQIENQTSIGSENYNSGKDFFASMVNLANQSAENNNNDNQQANTIVEQPKQNIHQEKHKQIIQEVKYFTDNGIMFKVENGIIYKKCWVSVELNELTDESGNKILPEYRIINSETGKQVKNEKYAVQHLVWKKLTDA